MYLYSFSGKEGYQSHKSREFLRNNMRPSSFTRTDSGPGAERTQHTNGRTLLAKGTAVRETNGSVKFVEAILKIRPLREALINWRQVQWMMTSDPFAKTEQKSFLIFSIDRLESKTSLKLFFKEENSKIWSESQKVGCLEQVEKDVLKENTGTFIAFPSSPTLVVCAEFQSNFRNRVQLQNILIRCSFVLTAVSTRTDSPSD